VIRQIFTRAVNKQSVPKSDPCLSAVEDDTLLAENTWLNGIYTYQKGWLTKIEDYES
jgi:hypothetical protein